MVQHERVLLFNSLLAAGANIVVSADKGDFYFVDSAGVALTGLLPVKGMRLLSKSTPAVQVKKGVAFGLSTALAVNTRYSFQIENTSKTYFSQGGGNDVYPSTTPVIGEQAALAAALYSDLARRVNLNSRSIISCQVVYKITVTHNAAVTPAFDAAVSQAGNATFSAKFLKGAFVNGASTLYVYSLTGVLDPAKAVVIGGTSSSATTPVIEAAGVYAEDKYDYGSSKVPGAYNMIPSTFISGSLSKDVINEGVMPCGQGSVLVRDAQVYVPGNNDLMYGKSEYNFTASPLSDKTYNILSIQVECDMPTGEMGDGAKPNIQSVYQLFVDTADGTKLAAFEAKLTEAALQA